MKFWADCLTNKYYVKLPYQINHLPCSDMRWRNKDNIQHQNRILVTFEHTFDGNSDLVEIHSFKIIKLFTLVVLSFLLCSNRTV